MKKFLLLTALLVCLCINKTYAWGREGHRMVAQVAKSQVSKEIHANIKYYLGEMSWEDAACWMDDVKGTAGSEYMKTWHYLNVARDKTSVKSKTPNLFNQLEYYIKILRNREMYTKEAVCEAIKIVFHLVGDFCQPLHCGYADDKGGTETVVKFLNHNSNLHKVWDSEIIEEKKLDIWACSKTLLAFSEDEKKNFRLINLNNWLTESKALLNEVYNFNNSVIDEAYINKSAIIIQRQLVIAGLRLAAILDANFKARS